VATNPTVPDGWGNATRTYSCRNTRSGNKLSILVTSVVRYNADHTVTLTLFTQSTYRPGGGRDVNCSGPVGARSYTTHLGNVYNGTVLDGPISHYVQTSQGFGGGSVCDDGTQVSHFFDFFEALEAS
jgi:hypothetical protein